jgi:hypothetical protein
MLVTQLSPHGDDLGEPFDRAVADAGSCPGNCAGMEESTGAPSSFAV